VFRSIVKSFYKGASGIILVYNSTMFNLFVLIILILIGKKAFEIWVNENRILTYI